MATHIVCHLMIPEFQIINALAMIYYLDINKFLKEAQRILSIDGTLFSVQAIKMRLDLSSHLLQQAITLFQN